MPSANPTIHLIAGCNGAGKTTFAKEFLLKEVNCPDFLNADYLALGLSPFLPESPAGLRADSDTCTLMELKRMLLP